MMHLSALEQATGEAKLASIIIIVSISLTFSILGMLMIYLFMKENCLLGLY